MQESVTAYDSLRSLPGRATREFPVKKESRISAYSSTQKKQFFQTSLPVETTYTVEPRFIDDLRYNDISGITINNRLPSKSYSKMYGAELRYNDLRYNDIPGLTVGLSLTERKTFLVITMKSHHRPREVLV